MAVQPNIFLNEYLDPIQESGEGSFSYNPRVEEYEDVANLGIIKQLFDKARRGYGQVDKNVFGGLLPGGAATPLGAKFQEVQKQTGQPPNSAVGHSREPLTYSKTAALLDTIATRLAGSQPFVENIVKNSPDFVRQPLVGVLNTLPISANLFSRYYTGIGNENLQIPSKLIDTVSEQVLRDQNLSNSAKTSSAYQMPSVKEMEELNAKLAQRRLNLIESGAVTDETGAIRSRANDELAQSRSYLTKLNSGQIQYVPYGNVTDKGNALDSPATAFGRLWLKPTPTGFQANERYDFKYADADRSRDNREYNVTPSQEQILMLVDEIKRRSPFSNSPGRRTDDYNSLANEDPLTVFGKAVVMKGQGRPFDYEVDFPITK